MIFLNLLLTLALTALDLDMVNVPFSSETRITLTPAGKGELRRENTITRLKIEIDRVAAPSTLGGGLNTYVVWAVSAEGIMENLGELNTNGSKGQFDATTRLTQFGLLITAEPHYMVDRPSSAVAYRAQAPRDDVRRRTASIQVGAYDYSALTQAAGPAVHGSVLQARAAFQIARSLNADSRAPNEFRSAQVALGSMEEMVARTAPIEILWPMANEAIRLSQHAATLSRK